MNQINPLSRAIALAFSSLIAVSALSGCGSSDDRKTPIIDSEHDHDHGDDHDHDDESAVSTEMEQGRLFITAKDGSQAYIYSNLFNYEFIFIAIDKSTQQIGIFDCSPEFLQSGQDKVKRACEAYDLFYKTEGFEPSQYFISKTL